MMLKLSKFSIEQKKFPKSADVVILPSWTFVNRELIEDTMSAFTSDLFTLTEICQRTRTGCLEFRCMEPSNNASYSINLWNKKRDTDLKRLL